MSFLSLQIVYKENVLHFQKYRTNILYKSYKVQQNIKGV